MTRGVGRTAIPVLLAVAAVIVVLSVGSARSELATPAALQVSLAADGPFADRLPHSLFRGVGRLVPGDRVERTLWVRNGSTTATRTTVQVGFDQTNELADALDFSVGIGGSPAVEGDASGHQTFSGRLELAPGQVQPVDVVMAFDRATRTQAMRQRTEVDLLVTITEDTGSRSGVDCREHVDVTRDRRSGVTTAPRRPECVPTGVASGQPGTVLGVPVPASQSAALALLAGLAVLTGASLSLRAARRRREVADRG